MRGSGGFCLWLCGWLCGWLLVGLAACDDPTEPPVGAIPGDRASQPDAGDAADAGSDAGTGAGGAGGVDAAGDGDGDGDGDGASPGDGDGDGDGVLDPDLDGGTADSSCFVGAQPISPSTGTGSCADPLAVDVAAGVAGDSYRLVLPSQQPAGALPPLGKCGQGATRAVVLAIQLPEQTDLELAVGGAGADAIVRVQPMLDDSCAAEPSTCADTEGSGGCEYLSLRQGGAAFKGQQLQLTVSDAADTGAPLTLHLRLKRPESGS